MKKKIMALTLAKLAELVARYPANAKVIDVIEKESK